MDDLLERRRVLLNLAAMIGLSAVPVGCKSSGYEPALRELRKAAEQGDARAQHSLSLKYWAGSGVTQDWEEAFKWSRKAAEQGDAHSQSFLGQMYQQGWGVVRDDVLAYMWYDLAADQGDYVAKSSRDTIAARMTPDQIEKAKKLAREWIERNLLGSG